MAKDHGARLTGVVLLALPGPDVLSRLGLAQETDAVDKMRYEARKLVQRFVDSATAAGIEHKAETIESREGKAAEKLAKFARSFDISIMRQANPDRPAARLINAIGEEVLFSSGRPVFFMPYIGAHAIPPKSGLIAWDGSAAAARAVHDAIPLLRTMQDVKILIVDADKMDSDTGTEPGEEISAHLSEHGIQNQVVRVLSGGAETSTIIQNEIADGNADILIMGGYGTPKLREIILGGVTRTLLNSMTVPVVMSH